MTPFFQEHLMPGPHCASYPSQDQACWQHMAPTGQLAVQSVQHISCEASGEQTHLALPTAQKWSPLATSPGSGHGSRIPDSPRG